METIKYEQKCNISITRCPYSLRTPVNTLIHVGSYDCWQCKNFCGFYSEKSNERMKLANKHYIKCNYKENNNDSNTK